MRTEGVSDLIRRLRRVIEFDREGAVRDRVGRQVAAIDAEHYDTYSTETYYGPRREKAPPGVVKGVGRVHKGLIDQPLICRDVDGNLVGGKGWRIRVLDTPLEPKGRADSGERGPPDTRVRPLPRLPGIESDSPGAVPRRWTGAYRHPSANPHS